MLSFHVLGRLFRGGGLKLKKSLVVSTSNHVNQISDFGIS